MGLRDAILHANIGTCIACRTKYVTYAEILNNDSHVKSRPTYQCPSCNGNIPTDVRPMEAVDKEFVTKQIEEIHKADTKIALAQQSQKNKRKGS